MQIVKTSRYLEELEIILNFIAKDSLTRALEFVDKLNARVLDLGNMPYKNRKSLKSDDYNIRDLIFYGYVIPYRVNLNQNSKDLGHKKFISIR